MPGNLNHGTRKPYPMPHRLRTVLASLLALLFLSQSVAGATAVCAMHAGGKSTPQSAPMDHSAHHAMAMADSDQQDMAQQDCCEGHSCAKGGCSVPALLAPLAASEPSPAADTWGSPRSPVSPRTHSETPQRPPSA